MMWKTCFCLFLTVWLNYQELSWYREQEIVEILGDREGYFLMDSNDDVRHPEYGMSTLVQWGFSRWWYGCLYPPIVDVTITDNDLDQKAWDQLRAFPYIESLGLRSCRLDPDADFSSFRHLQFLMITTDKESAHRTELSLQQIRSITRLPHLEYLALDIEAKAEWLEYIGQAQQLRTLSIGGDDVSDEGVVKLARLKELDGLNLAETGITSKSAPVLSQFKKLQWLNLAGTTIDDEGIAQLSVLPDLRVLHLDDTRITDVGMSSLARLSNLRELWLTNTNVTDAGVKHLSKLKGLCSLDLSGTQITNASIPSLAALPLLKPSEYVVKNTKIDEAGLKQWQEESIYTEDKSDRNRAIPDMAK